MELQSEKKLNEAECVDAGNGTDENQAEELAAVETDENTTLDAEQPASGVVGSEEQTQGQSIADVVNEAAMSMGMQVRRAAQVRSVLEQVARGETDALIVELIDKALSHDEDVANADAQGYLRGRNEKIDVINNFNGNVPATTGDSNFPRYAKRSVWDR